jgi:N-acetylneuraminate synthase
MRVGIDVAFVAEISANHLGSFENAKDLVRAAHDSGANFVKFQTYKPEFMTLKELDHSVSQEHILWGGKSLYDLYAEAMTPWEWHEELFHLARELGLQPFSSPFNRDAVDFLERLDCPIYKIASLETGDVDLIAYAASTGKPLIISTGATELSEIEMVVTTARENGASTLTLLVCTSSYPADPKDSHIRRIQTLKNEFGTDVGISDHTLGIGVSVAAIALGATVVEKHLTLSRDLGGHDSAFSLEPDEFASLVREGRKASQALGEPRWNIQPSEAESRRLRRSLYITKDVKKGELATRENIKALRPNLGGSILHLEQIVGRRFKEDFKAGHPASLDIVQGQT